MARARWHRSGLVGSEQQKEAVAAGPFEHLLREQWMMRRGRRLPTNIAITPKSAAPRMVISIAAAENAGQL